MFGVNMNFSLCNLISYQTNPIWEKKNVQEELDGLATNYPDQFKVYFVLNQVRNVSFCIIY